MRKLAYQKQEDVTAILYLNGFCRFCQQARAAVILVNQVGNTNQETICSDCAKQVVKILKKHGPIEGQMAGVGEVNFPPPGAFTTASSGVGG